MYKKQKGHSIEENQHYELFREKKNHLKNKLKSLMQK